MKYCKIWVRETDSVSTWSHNLSNEPFFYKETDKREAGKCSIGMGPMFVRESA